MGLTGAGRSCILLVPCTSMGFCATSAAAASAMPPARSTCRRQTGRRQFLARTTRQHIMMPGKRLLPPLPPTLPVTLSRLCLRTPVCLDRYWNLVSILRTPVWLRTRRCSVPSIVRVELLPQRGQRELLPQRGQRATPCGRCSHLHPSSHRRALQSASRRLARLSPHLPPLSPHLPPLLTPSRPPHPHSLHVT